MTSIPLETVFISNSKRSWRDPIKKNRIHFQYPEVWSNAIKNKPVIGLRNLFIAKAYRHPSIKISYDLCYVDNLWIGTGDQHKTVCSGVVSADKYFDDETLLKELFVNINNRLKAINLDSEINTANYFTEAQLERIKQTQFIMIYFEYTKDHHFRIVIKSPFNDLPDDVRRVTDGRPKEGDKTTGLSTISRTYYINFRVTELNEDARNLFGTLENPARVPSTPIYYIDAWDRNSCILYSNIAEQTDYGYLGHTRKQVINPVKYYVVNSSSQSFWVELYATCDHKVPVILPPEDELFIEAQLL